MRRILVAVALVALTVTAGCAGLASTGERNASVSVGGGQADTAGKTIVVDATGRVQAEPDRAVIQVAVTARADSAEAVREQLARNASRLREALDAMGLADDQVTSGHYDIGRSYDDDPGVPKYRGRHSFVITLDNTSRVGTAIVTAVQNGASEIENVRFTLSETTRQQLRKQALDQALASADEKAHVMANGTGLRVTGVRTVRTADVSVASDDATEAYKLTAAAADASVTSIDGGRVTVTAQVVVVYDASEGAE